MILWTCQINWWKHRMVWERKRLKDTWSIVNRCECLVSEKKKLKFS